jgi:N-acetylglucosamine malate deacetylase 2
MKKLLLLTLFLHSIIAGAQVQKGKNKKSILIVAAHPDDEIAIGGEVAVKYSRLGHKVFVIIATDGKGGTRVTNIPAGDSLGQIRRQESICAAQKMGIEPPIFLMIDRLDTKNGIRNYLDGYTQLLKLLKTHISNIKPDIILTYGPDGDSHHSEHIVISAAVTELTLREGWIDNYKLFYLANKHIPEAGYDIGTVREDYLTVKIDYSDEDELITLDADACFTSQFTKEEKDKDFIEKTNDKNNFKYYRQFIANREKLERGFF